LTRRLCDGWSKTKPEKVGDALPSAYGDVEEEGSGSRGRTELGLGGTEERSPDTDGLQRGGRDAVIGVKEEKITHVHATSREIYVDR
jgi:hypothetical protein